jgi:hypothetical protein
MRKSLSFICLTLLLAAPLLCAQETKPDPDGAGHRDKTHVRAEIVAVDLAKGTLTFRSHDGQQLTWKAEGKALDDLKSVQPGQKVKIRFRDGAGGEKTAIRIGIPGASRGGARQRPADQAPSAQAPSAPPQS